LDVVILSTVDRDIRRKSKFDVEGNNLKLDFVVKEMTFVIQITTQTSFVWKQNFI
jgi:hypothetical protein